MDISVIFCFPVTIAKQNRKGIIYEIDNNKNANDKYLVVWKPTSDYEKENHGYIHDWCNKDELTKY